MEENCMREVVLAVEAEVDGGGYSVGADALPLPQPVPPDERRVSSPQSPEGDSFPPPADAPRLPGMDDVAVPPRDADSLRSMKMRELLLRDLPDGWVQRLLELEVKLGRWELGALVLWLSLPKSMRRPRMMKDLAENVFGVSARTLSEWLHRPGVEEAVMATRLASLADYVPDTLEALGKLASTADYRNTPAMRLLLEMVNYYTPKADIGLGVPRWVSEASGKVSQASTDNLEGLAKIPDEEGTADEIATERH